MAQGTIKKKAKPDKDARKPSILGPKKGTRAIAPKNARLVRQRKITKKLSAGLITKTERNLAEKAGHLEILAGGKGRKKGGTGGGGAGGGSGGGGVGGKPAGQKAKAKEHFKGKSVKTGAGGAGGGRKEAVEG
ncbi:MAG: hypothetical protein MMC33_009454 [Icmadophila ericetorum]|nr:hypothetical protein [Icmadophila ericetorum]